MKAAALVTSADFIWCIRLFCIDFVPGTNVTLALTDRRDQRRSAATFDARHAIEHATRGQRSATLHTPLAQALTGAAGTLRRQHRYSELLLGVPIYAERLVDGSRITDIAAIVVDEIGCGRLFFGASRCPARVGQFTAPHPLLTFRSLTR